MLFCGTATRRRRFAFDLFGFVRRDVAGLIFGLKESFALENAATNTPKDQASSIPKLPLYMKLLAVISSSSRLISSRG